MITYAIGELYPHKDYRPGREEIRAVTDHSFFHRTGGPDRYYCSQPDQDGPNWQKGPLVYGLYIHEGIPCFLVHLTGLGLAFEVTINAHTIADDLIDGWLNSDRTLVPMLLMEPTPPLSGRCGCYPSHPPWPPNYEIVWSVKMPVTLMPRR